MSASGETGRIGATVAESTPWWEDERRARPGAPNVIVIVLDDMGWSDFGCFGSEISTPHIDALAGDGVRFNNFNVTPLCSPTRASLLTGQNHHSVGMRFLAVADSGYPNARGQLPKGVPTIPGILRERGYGTYLSGKWHLAPQHELSPAGPFSNWPLAHGFERFYGFLGGASDQYAPELYRDNSPVEPSSDPDYHLSTDLVEKSIGYLSDHIAYRQGDPFFLQLAFGATHAPFQVPAEWTERYRGRYAEGWDAVRAERLERQKALGVVPADTRLAERDDAVPHWDALSEPQRARAERGQETFAAFLEHTDAQIGLLVGWLREVGQLENTVIALFSDNGAAGDGGELGTMNTIAPYNNLRLPEEAELAGLAHAGDQNHPVHYAAGWAMAGNTPFRLYKQNVDLGGTRSPLVMHWPGGAAGGGLRGQFAHVVDLAATILDLALADADDERTEILGRMHGTSFLPALLAPASAAAPHGCERDTQYYEMLGHRAVWSAGWRAVTRHVGGTPYEADRWRLYNTAVDFSESTDLAASQPEQLERMKELWWAEARRFGVLPLDDRSLKELLGVGGRATRPQPTRLVLRPGQSHLGFTTRLTGTNRSMRARARFELASGTEEGVLLASGTGYGGYTLYVLDGRLCFEHRLLAEHVEIRSSVTLPTGPVSAGFLLQRGDGRSALAQLFINDEVVGSASIPTTSMQLAFYGLDVGLDRASPVSERYSRRGSFPFPPASLRDVTLDFADTSEDAALLSHLMEANQ